VAEHLLRQHEALSSNSTTANKYINGKLDVLLHTFNANSPEIEAGESHVQG
jgi:hypothetical protein